MAQGSAETNGKGSTRNNGNGAAAATRAMAQLFFALQFLRAPKRREPPMISNNSTETAGMLNWKIRDNGFAGGDRWHWHNRTLSRQWVQDKTERKTGLVWL